MPTLYDQIEYSRLSSWGDGRGSGSGYNNGSGNGDGSGSGRGNGSGRGSGEGYNNGSGEVDGEGDGNFKDKPSPQQLLKLKGKTLEQLLWIKRSYEL